MTEEVCLICGIPWKDGIGFVGKHIAPCANDRYGWCFVKPAEDDVSDTEQLNPNERIQQEE